MTCTSKIPAGHRLALLTLGASGDVYVRDISDLTRPVNLCVFKSSRATFFRFVDPTHVTYYTEGTSGNGALYQVDLQARSTSLLLSWDEQNFSWVHAWSPDGTTLSYLTSSEWHLRSAAGDVMLNTVGGNHGGTIVPNDSDGMVGFSPDGKYIALELVYEDIGAGADSLQVIRLSDHKLVYSRKEVTMATWSGSGARLYFRTSAGVEAWDATTGVQLVLAGSKWIRPTASQDGTRIAYTTVDTNGTYHAWYLRTADRPAVGIQFSRSTRACPAFLTPTLVWYSENVFMGHYMFERCGRDAPPQTGRTYLRDLVTGTETLSVITNVFDSWPHSAAA